MKKFLLSIGTLVLFSLSTIGVTAHAASPILDTNGNQVSTNHRYKIAIKNASSTDHFLMTDSRLGTNWEVTTTNPNNSNNYILESNTSQLTTDSSVKLNDGVNGWLRYQGSGTFFPYGGLRVGDHYGSINVKFSPSTDQYGNNGYHWSVDDGPVYYNQNDNSLVTTSKHGNYFVSTFTRVD